MPLSLKIAVSLIGSLLLLLLLALFGLWATQWRPRAETVLFPVQEAQATPVPQSPQAVSGQLTSDTLTILTWNTGYAGLGREMDFFMDGGRQTRATREQTEENLRKITGFLQQSGADILLLEEVDRHSRRSYSIDQLAAYREALPEYVGFFAPNYDSPYVPIPLREPLGRVQSGVVLFSKVAPEVVTRFQYPGGYGFPRQMFDLKRCLLQAQFLAPDGRALYVGVTHNSAYDNGSMRSAEMGWLQDHLTGLAAAGGLSITGGDWNQNPPGYTPSAREVDDRHFSPKAIPAELFDSGWHFASDPQTPTVRYLYEPLTEQTTRSTIDFFLTSPGIECLSVKTIDLGFANSDHNPVIAKFKIK
jgi:endonuclease/exonuclease/phosphatase family metal-dependent hydrolase